MSTAAFEAAWGRAVPAGANGVLRLDLLGKEVFVVGGPFRKAPNDAAGFVRVKLAQEIQAGCEIDLPIRDFSTPKVEPTVAAVKQTLDALAQNRLVYVGCMGGFGRTGLFLACLAKACGIADPVAAVRAQYTPHAVETPEQKRFVEDFPVDWMGDWIARRQKPLAPALPEDEMVHHWTRGLWDLAKIWHAVAWGWARAWLNRR